MRIEGRRRLEAKLRAMPQEAKRDIRAALEKSAGEMTDLARRFAPVRSGALKASIGYTFGNFRAANPSVRGVAGGGGRLNDQDLTVTVHAGDGTAYYAAFVEFGTSRASAKPFFFPAYRLVKKRIAARVSRATTKAARRAAGRSS